ncbi:MAG: FAD-binding oxidoreductase [Deltaproteobacteria bacterium]|nr:FAD-binding oxidoreductase [Deltaproteobacteria bacterium]
MTTKYDAIIIGAGISGAAIALELSQKGFKTLNVEKLGDSGLGSTGNTCAIIRTHYSTLEGTALAYDSYFYWKDWESYVGRHDEKGLARFNDIGILVIKPKGFDFSKYLDLHDALGIPYEKWSPEKLLKRMPHFVDDSFYPPQRPEDPAFGDAPTEKINPTVIYFPRGGYVNDATLSVHNIQRAAEARGAAFLFNAEVVAIRKAGGRVDGVTLADGRAIDAPVVVNAAGPHSFVVNRMAGVDEKMKIKTRSLRHEVHFVPSPESFSYEKEGIIVSDGDAGGYHRPEAGDLILVGSEDPACDTLEWIDDPNDFNREVTREQWNAQVYRIAKRIPGLAIPGQPRGVVDLYDVSDDWIPIYDKTDLPGFYLAIGTSGNQYKNGPVIGQILAEIITACEAGHDHDREPVQVGLRNIDYTLNSGIFSRNREIIEGSTFSVLG